jgi:hypothetical protein
MKASDLYGDIIESEPRSHSGKRMDIVESAGVTNIEKCYYEWNKYYAGDEPEKVPLGQEALAPEEEKYQEAVGLAKDTEYDEKALQEFLASDWHKKFEEVNDDTRVWPRYEVDGIFVSAFVNQLDQEKIVLPDLENTSCVGYRNRKELVIEGNTDAYLGKKMEEGSITVEGTTHSAGVDSKAGEIFVEDDIGGTGESCGANVYTRKDNNWKEVQV